MSRFGLARAAIDRGDPAATSNAEFVQRLEQTLHIAVEHSVNNAMLGNVLAIYSTGYFYRLCVLAVPAVLIWLYVCWPARYRYLRTVVVVTTLLDLPLVWLFPEAPPRFAQDGVVDYMATYDILNAAASRTPQPGLNLLAAMPSMHIAWTTWCAYAAWSVLRQRQPARRMAGMAVPLAHRVRRTRDRTPLRPGHPGRARPRRDRRPADEVDSPPQRAQ